MKEAASVVVLACSYVTLSSSMYTIQEPNHKSPAERLSCWRYIRRGSVALPLIPSSSTVLHIYL